MVVQLGNNTDNKLNEIVVLDGNINNSIWEFIISNYKVVPFSVTKIFRPMFFPFLKSLSGVVAQIWPTEP